MPAIPHARDKDRSRSRRTLLHLLVACLVSSGCGEGDDPFEVYDTRPRYFRPHVVTDGTGGVVIAATDGWSTTIPEEDEGAGSIVTSGVEWAPATVIQADDLVGTQNACAIDSEGRVFVLWFQEDEIRSRRYDPDSGWGPSQRVNWLSEDPQAWFTAVGVYASANGRALATWYQDSKVNANNDQHQGPGWAVYDPDTARWTRRTSRFDTRRPSAALGGDGSAWAAYESYEPGQGVVLERQVGDSPWEVVRTYDGSRPHVAAGENGTAILAWRGTDGAVYAIVYDPDGPGDGWSDPRLLGENQWGPRVTMSQSGAHAVVLTGEWQYPAYYAYRHSTLAGWSGEEAARGGFSLGPEHYFARTAVDEEGNIATVWWHAENRKAPVGSVRMERFDAASEAWQGTEFIEESVDRTTGRPDVAIDPVVGTVVVWEELFMTPAGTPGARVVRHIIGGTGPRFSATPNPAVVNQSVTFDASESMTAGTILSYEWDFEDDGTYDASGGSPIAAHTYTTPGTHRARLRITDDLGKQFETVQDIEVGAGGLRLEIVVSGNGGGRVHVSPLGEICTQSCTIDVTPGTTVELLSLPDEGSTLEAFLGCDQPGDTAGVQSCTFTMTTDRMIEFLFVLE